MTASVIEDRIMALQLHKDSINISSNSEFVQSNDNRTGENMKCNKDTHLRTSNKNNLQSLLHMSTSLQNSEGGTRPTYNVDKEKELFFNEALQTMSTDPFSRVKNIIAIIRLLKTRHCETEEYESVLEELIEHVCCIDIAKCFYQMGGLNAITPLLKHNNCKVRSLTAKLISECCQNHPYCQELTVSDEVFSSIIDIARDDEDCTAKFYALSAISAIVRDNPKGIQQFKNYKGFALLKKNLTLQDSRITAKISFFIAYLSQISYVSKGDWVEADVVPALIEAITMFNNIYPVQALLSLMSNHPYTIQQTCQHGKTLKEYIKHTLSESDTEVDCELVECCLKMDQLMDEYTNSKNEMITTR